MKNPCQEKAAEFAVKHGEARYSQRQGHLNNLILLTHAKHHTAQSHSQTTFRLVMPSGCLANLL